MVNRIPDRSDDVTHRRDCHSPMFWGGNLVMQVSQLGSVYCYETPWPQAAQRGKGVFQLTILRSQFITYRSQGRISGQEPGGKHLMQM